MTVQEWGRVDADGTVWVRTSEGERAVGSYPGATEAEALAYFGRKFDDLAAQVGLLEQRLRARQVSAGDAQATIRRLEPQIREANAVGDLEGLLTRLTALAPVADQQREEAQSAKREAREVALAARTALVDEAEALSAVDAERIPWKASGDRLRQLFEEWRRMQRDARLDKPTEDELWKRFSHARTTFDRKRRHYFGALDEQRSQAREVKEELIAEAEALSTSTDWGRTAGTFRDLMTRWKQAGRASQKEDDALWARFRAAQDAFFAARQAANSAEDAEFAGNLRLKEQLAAEAEALLPVRNLESARSALRDVQARWDEIGKVPRPDLGRIEGRLRRVEQAVRDADQDRWRRGNPEARARANDLVQQLETTITGLESDLSKARNAGNERRIRDVEQSLEARREWLAQARQALEEFAD